MLTRLRAENFKSWKDTGELRLAPLTGLFGANSSGKSSILQILLMLKQTVESLDRNRVLDLGDENSLLNLGTFADLIHGHELNIPLKFSLKWYEKPPPPPHPSISNFIADEVRFDASIVEREEHLRVSEFEYSIAGHRFGMKATSEQNYDYMHDGRAEKHVGSPIKFFGFPPETTAHDPAFMPDLDLPPVLQQTLGDVKYLGPLRQYPQRIYRWRGITPFDIGRDGGEAIQALIANRGKRLAVEQSVAKWLKSMKLINSFRLEPVAPNRSDYEVRVKNTPTSVEVLLPDVGFGVSQVLPVLVLCYYVPEGSTVIIEQPEIHLHPSAQSELADMLIDVVKNRKVQVIMESHSEHLLRRLQRRIAEGELPAEDAAIYFCSMEDGASKAEELKIGDDGLVKNWPNDFFGDEMGEVAALTEAAMKRHILQTK
jgi:hypothetical protein